MQILNDKANGKIEKRKKVVHTENKKVIVRGEKHEEKGTNFQLQNK